MCETKANVLAVHSQDMNVPECPRNWEGLWIGYSFAMVSQWDNVIANLTGSANPGNIRGNRAAKIHKT